MKCPKCRAEKAYLRKVDGWKGALMSCALLAPLKCNHCCHEFVVSWFATIGRTVKPPKLRSQSAWSDRPSYAARQRAITPSRRKVVRY